MKNRSNTLVAERARQGRTAARPETQSSTSLKRRLPVGAEIQPGGGVHFRVWAPRQKKAAVQLGKHPEAFDQSNWNIDLEPEKDGYFSGLVQEAEPGMLYKFRFESGAFPDPASRFQPRGPHGPSQVIDSSIYKWHDRSWKGVSRKGQVIYEMHVGTFTREGTWRAAMEELRELADLGITIIEMMPVADFPGRFGWGYDGVDLFAPTCLYGRPDDLRAFIDRAHGVGIGVILDVVYNHLGPDGNYLKQFSEDYFSNRYKNEWGEAINFDGENCEPVREFFISNAGYWIDEFHFDGLRLDATQQIFDSSKVNVMTEITRRIRETAKKRGTYIVAENEPQHVNLVKPEEQGGYGMDALWNDDFHHSAVVALTGKNEAYYTDYKGTPQEFISAMKWGYLYQGQWYRWQKKRRGTPTFGLEPAQFVTFIQNHDQIANSLRGFRIHDLTRPGDLRAMTALFLLGPGTPMLFQGQEFAASNPFLYFADHNPELARLVAKGRREFISQFPSYACGECGPYMADPEALATFERCKLDFSERQKHEPIYRMHRDLLKLRREDSMLKKAGRGDVDGAVLSNEAFVLRFFNDGADDRLLIVNLGNDLHLDPAPEPLLAPMEDFLWGVKWSSESPLYGGNGTPPIETTDNWHIPGHSAIFLAPQHDPRLFNEQRQSKTNRRTA